MSVRTYHDRTQLWYEQLTDCHVHASKFLDMSLVRSVERRGTFKGHFQGGTRLVTDDARKPSSIAIAWEVANSGTSEEHVYLSDEVNQGHRTQAWRKRL